MAENAKALCTIKDVEYAFRLARILIDQLRTLRSEFFVFCDGWSDDDIGEAERPGNPTQIQALYGEIQDWQLKYEEYGGRIDSCIKAANINSLTPFVYDSPLLDAAHDHPVTAFGAVSEQALIATEACARLIFRVDSDGQPRSDIPQAGSEQFRAECAACEHAMRAVTAAELARLEALVAIEELRTLEWLLSDIKPLNWSIARSPSDWLKVFARLNLDCRSLKTFARRRGDGTYRQHPDSTTKSVKLALDCLPDAYRDDITV